MAQEQPQLLISGIACGAKNVDEAAFLPGLSDNPPLFDVAKSKSSAADFVLDRMRHTEYQPVVSAKEQPLILRSVSGPG